MVFSLQTYIPLLWYSPDHPSSNQVLVLLLGRLTRLENKLYLWLKFVTINSTEQKQQDRNKICIREVCYRSPWGLHRMCFLSGSKWQGYKQCFCPGKPILMSRSEAFLGGLVSWAHRAHHVLQATSHDIETRDPSNETRSMSSMLMFVQPWQTGTAQSIEPGVHHKNHQSISDTKNILRSMFPGLSETSVMVPVSLRALKKVKQPDLLLTAQPQMI